MSQTILKLLKKKKHLITCLWLNKADYQ